MLENDYLLGEKLYGDDFTIDQIQQWYVYEKEAYANLGAKNRSDYIYAYHKLNIYLGYKHLPMGKFTNVLSFGGAYGDELLPIIDRIGNITILEPSDMFKTNNLNGVKLNYIKPSIEGDIPFENNFFDLTTSFGVLHHIPNVTHVLREIYRSTKKGGYCLIREPIISMGDWTTSRSGLTKNERGIPLKIFYRMIMDIGFRVKKGTLCGFPLIRNISNLSKRSVYNISFFVFLDKIFSYCFSKNYSYHAQGALKIK